MAEVNLSELNVPDYPANPTKRQLQKKTTKVVEGSVSRPKKSLGKKLEETFLSATFAEVITDCVSEVVIPSVKNMLYDAISGGFQMLLWGEIRDGGKRGRNGPYVDYASRSRYSTTSSKRDDPPFKKAHRNIDDVYFETKSDAYNVLDNLMAAVDKYGEVRVSDLNDLIGEAGEFTDEKFGWTNLSRAEIKRYRNGWLLVLPNVIPLDE